jgi:hypothetical protein
MSNTRAAHALGEAPWASGAVLITPVFAEGVTQCFCAGATSKRARATGCAFDMLVKLVRARQTMKSPQAVEEGPWQGETNVVLRVKKRRRRLPAQVGVAVGNVASNRAC